MGKLSERVLKNNSLKPNAASHNNASWYTDTDGFLEHSPSWGKPALQGACPPEDKSGVSWLPPHMYIGLPPDPHESRDGITVSLPVPVLHFLWSAIQISLPVTLWVTQVSKPLCCTPETNIYEIIWDVNCN